MIGKGKTLLVHDDCVVSRVAHRLEELCGEIELCPEHPQKMPPTCQWNTAAPTKSR